jgi:UDP:flavonoid glycosyltransferase YjiC (YdhE family)
MTAEKNVHVAFACVDQLGHFMPLTPFIRELLQRGHRVTLFVSDSTKYSDKIQELDLQDAELIPVKLPGGDQKHEVFKALGWRRVVSKGGPLAILSEPLFNAIVSHYGSSTALPSVIVADFFTTAANDAGDALGVPVITVFPNPRGLGPGLLHPGLRGPSQKILTVLARLGEAVGARFFLALRNRERSFRNLPPMDEQDVWPCDTMRRPVLTTWGLGYEYPCLQSPLHTFVGPSEPLTFPPISGDLATWFEKQAEPIVYVAFGTMHKFSSESCRCLLKQLELLDGVAVLWSLPADQQSLLDTVSSNVRLETFVPQYAVLQHAKVAVFVTHCGSNSVGEAILAETPLVCCPMMADQPANAARIQSAGIGITSPNGVRGVGLSVRTVLDGLDVYRARIHKLKGILLSHGGAKRGADTIEAVAACGYEHLVPLERRFPWMRSVFWVCGAAFAYTALMRALR